MERYLNLGDAGISGNSTLLKEATAHVNEIQRRVWHMIFTSYSGWQWDDSNQTDLPASTATLTSGQTSYALPSGALTVRGIEVKDSNGNWHTLSPITEEQIRESQPMGEFYETSGTPLYYQLVGDSARIFPASNWTQASSFKVFFDRGSVAFASTDTTKTPGFASEYHGILPLGASLEYLKAKLPTSPNIPIYTADYREMEMKLKQYYMRRNSNMLPNRLRVRDSAAEAK